MSRVTHSFTPPGFTVGAANNTPACQPEALPARYRRTASLSTYTDIADDDEEVKVLAPGMPYHIIVQVAVYVVSYWLDFVALVLCCVRSVRREKKEIPRTGMGFNPCSLPLGRVHSTPKIIQVPSFEPSIFLNFANNLHPHPFKVESIQVASSTTQI